MFRSQCIDPKSDLGGRQTFQPYTRWTGTRPNRVYWAGRRFLRITWKREWQEHREIARESRATSDIEPWRRSLGFYALLGSVNGKTAMRMLLDHKSHIEYRTVEKIILVGDNDDDKEPKLKLNEAEARSFIILLSEKRQPPSQIPILSHSQ